jgi:Mrp family chromosome partitioning ATPase
MATGFDVVTRIAPVAEPHPQQPCLEVDEKAPVALDPDRLAAHGICALDPLDPRSRSFFMLRAQIANNFYNPGGRVMAVTSAQPGNGKSFVALNLAIAVGRVQPVILVDLDLSKPSIGERLGLKPVVGVDDYLAGEVKLAPCRQRIDDLRLTVLPVRQRRLDPVRLLSGERFDALFHDLADPDADPNADPLIIIDTPPTLAIDEILAIAGKVEGMVLVAEEGQSRSSELREAMELLEPTPIIGTVLNKSISNWFRRQRYAYYGDRA